MSRLTIQLLISALISFYLTVVITFNYNKNNEGGSCRSTDFEYHYTECDLRGQRWRYAIPKSNARHCIASTPLPQPGLNCSFKCLGGHFLDMEKQECRRCSPGTYSLGNGVRYQHLTSMPHGFTVENYEDETDSFFATDISKEQNSFNKIECSNQVGWIVQNGELRYVPTECISKLSISLNLVHDGYIQFYYKMPKNSRSLLAILQVRNAFCQSYGETRSMFLHSINHLFPHAIDNGVSQLSSTQSNSNANSGNEIASDDFQVKRIPIRAGQNLLVWTVANNRELTTLADIIHVAAIDIVGLAFTPICSACPEGTFSQSGAQKCEICSPGTFSHGNAFHCQNCNSNEYSGPKASKCIRRPACESFDYYKLRDFECSTNGTQKGIPRIKRIKPLICEESAFRKLDVIEENDYNCPPCSAGMHRSLITGRCEYCKNDEYSTDGNECLKCKPNTTPLNGIYLTRWDSLPPDITTGCEYLFAGQMECNISPTWIPFGDRIESAQTRALGIALSLNIEISSGFYNPLRTGGISSKASPENPIARISIDFEMKCTESTCQLYLIQEQLNHTITNGENNQFQVIAAFNGTQKRTTLIYPILKNCPTRFVIAFMRSRVELEEDVVTDRAIIYSLNITHVGDSDKRQPKGGAVECVPCPMKDHQGKYCQPCPMGHYISNETTCIKCPFGTALNMTSSMRGIESCIKCGMNLGSEDGTECKFSGRFELNTTFDDNDESKIVQFDITGLKNKILKADGIRVFAREGNSYFHTFNISLFGEPVRCSDTFNTNSGIILMHSTENSATSKYYKENDNALFCRAAVIPSLISNRNTTNGHKDSKSVEDAIFLSSTIISRQIAAVTRNRTFRGFYLSNDQLDYDSSILSAVRPIDIHIFYEPLQTRIPRCPLGILGVVTLRCELTAIGNPLVRLSRRCPDGTCDGCLYHVIIESASACPICHSNDFEEIRGECTNNFQKIHYIPSKHCVLSGAQNRERIEPCASATTKLFLLLLLAALIITFLIVAVVVIYEKNRSLEYRYMRIVEGKDLDDLNVCALRIDEDEDKESIEQQQKTNKNDDSKTRVFFQKNKNNYKVTLNNKLLTNMEASKFLTDSSDDNDA